MTNWRLHAKNVQRTGDEASDYKSAVSVGKSESWGRDAD